jgi:hypothetical protein
VQQEGRCLNIVGTKLKRRSMLSWKTTARAERLQEGRQFSPRLRA